MAEGRQNYEGPINRKIERGGGPGSVDFWKKELSEDMQPMMGMPLDALSFKAKTVAYKWAKRQTDMEQESMRDPLTKAFSRQAGMEIMRQEIGVAVQDGGKVGVAMLDLDYFKAVAISSSNDARQILAAEERGDKAVAAYAKLIDETVVRHQEAGELAWGNMRLIRMGGEELVLVASQIKDQADFAEILNQIRLEIQDKLAERAGIKDFVQGSNQTQTVSMGAVVIDRENLIDTEGALHLADEALYDAKELGRNRVEFRQVAATGREIIREHVSLEDKWKALDKEGQARREKRIAGELGKKIADMVRDPGYREQNLQVLAEELDKLEQDIVLDSMTNVYKRGAGARFLQEAIAMEKSFGKGHGVGLALLNIDGFADINTRFTHDGGDRVLKQCAAMCEEVLKNFGEDDGIVVRWKPGGEFLIGLKHCADVERIAMVAQEIGTLVKRDLASKAGIFGDSVTVSAGVTLAKNNIEEAMEILTASEKAAKNQGRNRMVVLDAKGGDEAVVMFG